MLSPSLFVSLPSLSLSLSLSFFLSFSALMIDSLPSLYSLYIFLRYLLQTKNRTNEKRSGGKGEMEERRSSPLTLSLPLLLTLLIGHGELIELKEEKEFFDMVKRSARVVTLFVTSSNRYAATLKEHLKVNL